MKAPRTAGTADPEGRLGRSEVRHAVGLAKGVLAQYGTPLTLRQVFYRLVAMGAIPNTRRSYQALSKVLVRGDVDEERIEDGSGRVLGEGDWGFSSPEEFLDYQVERLRSSHQEYTRKLWERQKNRVFVSLEKDSLSKILADVAAGFRVQVYPTRGCDVRRMAEKCTGDKHNVILHFGDFDPSGMNIERDLARRLAEYGAEDFEVVRVALKEEQIREFGLPPRPEDAGRLRKPSRTYGAGHAAELEALDPDVLKDLAARAISRFVDWNLWEKTVRRIKAERRRLEKILGGAKVVFASRAQH